MRGRLPDDVQPGSAAQAWRQASGADRPPARPAPSPSAAPEPEEWILEEVRHEADRAVARGGRRAGGAPKRTASSKRPADPRPAGKGSPPRKPGASGEGATSGRAPAPRRRRSEPSSESPAAGDTTLDELTREVGARRAGRLDERLKDASRAFRRERFAEARQMLRSIVEEAPGSTSARELLGLTYYRLGRWKEAARELEVYRRATGSTDQHPVLADCYRGLRRWAEVEELWDELRAASPGAALVAEGRIVAAGALADQGRLSDAIALLDKGRWRVRQPREHHLRMGYALADLYERSGDVALARELFGWVAASDADFADVRDRLRSLR